MARTGELHDYLSDSDDLRCLVLGRVLEIAEAGEVRATRHVFGSEPTDAELHQFLLRHGTALLERAQAVYCVLDCTKTTGTTDVDAETRR